MPIGAGTAALIGGGLAAAGTIGGAVINSSGQKSAAKSADKISQQNSRDNIAFLERMYGQNAGRLDPFAANGLMASNALSDLLLGSHGGGAAPALPTSGGGTSALAAYRPGDPLPTGGYFVGYAPDGSIRAGNYAEGGLPSNLPRNSSTIWPAMTGDRQSEAMQSHDMLTRIAGARADDRLGQALIRATQARLNQQTNVGMTHAPAVQQPVPQGTVTASPAAGGSSGSALDAFDRFRQGTNYQWRLGQGTEALNGSVAAKGMFQSGAADKARIEYGQNFASNELARYMDLLAGQQSMGLGAASALAGVGQNFAGNVVAQNSAAAQNSANLAISRGNSNAQMWGQIGGALGQLGGSIYQSSFPTPTFDYGVLSSPIYDGVWQ